VRAISGDPVYVYFGIVDARRPYAVGVNGNGAITIEGTAGPGAPTIDQVTNADQNNWDHLGKTPDPTDPTPTATRTCTGADLQAVADPTTDAAMGNVKYVIRLTNISTTPCSMPAGPVALTAVDATNQAVPLATGHGTYFGDPPPLTGPLSPQGTAVLWLGGGQPTLCKDSAITWPGYNLELPDHTRVHFTATIDTGCAIGISTIGSPDK
jgi:hypothetical protein